MTAGAAQKKPFTVEELFALPDDGKRHEIYEGEVCMIPPPNLGHQHVSKELQYLLTQHIKKHKLGELYNAPVALILSEINYTEPDLVYVSNERRAVLTRQGIEGAPDLVVEILSPSTKSRDLEIKKAIYQKAGIPHYWIVDPTKHELYAYELKSENYLQTATHQAADNFKPTLFPDLHLDLSQLWRS